MKKLHLFLLLGIASLFTTACMKDDEATGGVKSFDSFRIDMPSLTTDNKAYLDFAASLSKILYEEGDVVYVNHQPFTLHYMTDHWVAQGDVAVQAETFYCCHASGVVTKPSGVDDDSPSYKVNIDGNPSPYSGIILAGKTTTNVLTFKPAFAVLVFKDESNEYSSVKIGFDGNKIPRIYTISADSDEGGSISINAGDAYFTNAEMTNHHSYLTMKKPAGKDYFYIAVPIEGNSVSTKLYIQYEHRTPARTNQRITSGAVTLQRGHLYVLPDDDMSDYPFDVDGAGKYKFSVGGGKYVRFSVGNLQFNPQKYINNQEQAYRFAPHQYDRVAQSANVNLSSNNNFYMDLLAWGASGNDNDGLDPWETEDNSEEYGDGEQDLGVLDWGHCNTLPDTRNHIYYGSARTTLNWRTLTRSEWSNLISRTGKVGFATINGIYGMVLLPDNWVPPSDVSFSPSSINSYLLEQWDKMEKAGAIFLPACGYRSDPSATVLDGAPGYNELGRYWSSSYDDAEYSWFLKFNCTNRSNGIDSDERKFGMSVRLVTEDGANSAQ